MRWLHLLRFAYAAWACLLVPAAGVAQPVIFNRTFDFLGPPIETDGLPEPRRPRVEAAREPVIPLATFSIAFDQIDAEGIEASSSSFEVPVASPLTLSLQAHPEFVALTTPVPLSLATPASRPRVEFLNVATTSQVIPAAALSAVPTNPTMFQVETEEMYRDRLRRQGAPSAPPIRQSVGFGPLPQPALTAPPANVSYDYPRPYVQGRHQPNVQYYNAPPRPPRTGCGCGSQQVPGGYATYPSALPY